MNTTVAGRAAGWIGRRLGNPVVSGCFAVALTAAAATGCVHWATRVLYRYGVALFMGLPLTMGVAAALIHGCGGKRSPRQCINVALLSGLATSVSLLELRLEGIICILMASPLALALLFCGAVAGWWVQARWHDRRWTAGATVLALAAMPALMGAQGDEETDPPLRRVRTAVVIDAPPELVWRHVVEFSDIPDVPEWFFRAGIAYPVRARIEGRGVGAIRYCEFTTGPFVEPITTWNEPHLLAFDVASNPPCLRELNPFGEVHAAHAHGYLASERGQLKLDAMPGHRTRLEGTTWYRHAIAPDWYWGVWSDAIIHRIHGRVLRRIADLAEAEREGAMNRPNRPGMGTDDGHMRTISRAGISAEKSLADEERM